MTRRGSQMMRVTRDEFLEAVKAQLDLDPDEPMELTPRQMAKVLEIARATIRGPDKYNPGELEIPCPICEALPGEECKTIPAGVWLPGPHPHRRMEAAELRMKRAVEGL